MSSRAPVKRAPDTIFPMVTGNWFHHHHWPTETGAWNNIPAGIRNMLTIECSYPCAKKVMIGSHIAATLPSVDLDANANATPKVTIQLQRTPLTIAAIQPL